ncbi:nucleotidyl transferase AbiEii/AbiGii toxin family protein [Candidatus Peregrinibacteria bacterium]|nr:nucleotidyl transferase AbiEii/AbiGii toxin family protein [Candidatus Peregrinibacteria bacterium]
MNLYLDLLPRSTKQALDYLASQKWFKKTNWYLSGGTALALYEGHRKSLDLDFFLPEKQFSQEKIVEHFKNVQWITDIVREGTLYGRLLKTKTSFIAFPFFIPYEQKNFYGSVKILAPADIAVMKVIAISQRGKMRDFIDLYWYTKKHESLINVIKKLPKQYPTVAHDYHHIIKSLIYFEDAENDPMPRLYFDTTWKSIKSYFRHEIPIITRKLLHLS